MTPNNSNTMFHHRLASIALMVCAVFQLGACPCGCVEHNAWVQMIGLQDHEHDTAISSIAGPNAPAQSDAGLNVGGDEHDCTGEGRPQYVNNARNISALTFLTESSGESSLTLATATPSKIATLSKLSLSPPGERLHALSRPVTQVFRL